MPTPNIMFWLCFRKKMLFHRMFLFITKYGAGYLFKIGGLLAFLKIMLLIKTYITVNIDS